MARTAVRLVFAAMLALLATQAPAQSVRLVAAIEVIWLVQSEVRQQAPRKTQRATQPAPAHKTLPPFISFIASAPDLVLIYQLPPPEFSIAS